MNKRFTKGLRLPDFKYRGLSSTKIHTPPAPRFVTISLGEHAKPCVQTGGRVLVGQKIAKGENASSVPIHASVSGSVSEVTEHFIRIESDESDTLDPSIRPAEHPDTEPEILVETIREAGIVELDGTAVPIHPDLIAARTANIHTVIVNGCESEPFLTADHLLMLNHAADILKGAELLRIAAGAEQAVIAVEDNKRELAELLNSKNYGLKIKTVSVQILPTRYPQGMPRTLAQTITGRAFRAGEALTASGAWVTGVATAFAVYEAVFLRKPLYERVVTVGGPSVIEPKNFWARIGTSAADLIRASKGLMREPERLILGGPMTGEAIPSFETPITPKTRAVLTLPAELTGHAKEEPCIRCGLCVDICPEALVPEMLIRAVRKGNQALAEEYELAECTECGVCAYICPSKIPIVDVIRQGKIKPAAGVPALEPADALSHRP